MTTPDLVFAGAAVVAGVFVLRALLNRAQRISKEDLVELVKQGAQVVDVRTPQEYAQAHARDSRNIPLDELSARVSELERGRPVVVCCASGARAGMAKSLLERAGFAPVHNAGPWQSVN